MEGFDEQKLLKAIKKATGYNEDGVRIAEEVAGYVVKKLDNSDQNVITTPFINALVEGYLYARFEKTKKASYRKALDKYIANKRRKQDELMQKVSHLHDVITSADNIRNLRKFSFNQTQIAAARYLLRNVETGEVIETIPEWFHRVASHVVLGTIMYDEAIYDSEDKYIRKTKTIDDVDYTPKNLGQYQIQIIIDKFNELIGHMKANFHLVLKTIDTKLWDKYQYLYKQYYDFMHEGIFEPNTPTLLNFGTPSGAGSACFTIKVEDSMESIMKSSHDAAFIFKTAGGFGTNVSYIRPKGSPVGNTYNAATGPIALVLEQINFLTDIVKAGGKRRGANMGIMEYWHPQIEEFIDYKLTPGKLENFNISVMFDESFWYHYNNDFNIALQFKDKIYGGIKARDLIKKIADNAWKSAEPGVLFADNANKKNPLREMWGDIKITNPCVSDRTRLHTNKGMKQVEELYEKQTEIEVAVDSVMHKSFRRYSKQNETQMLQKQASKVFKTADDADLIRIETEDGYELECTPYHPMVLLGGEMKEASQLIAGKDLLLLQSTKGLFGHEGSEDVGALLGFANNHMEMIKPEDKLLRKLFDRYTELNKFDYIYYETKQSKPEGEYVPLNLILHRANFIPNVVPDIIWEGKEECVRAYLNLLFSTTSICEVSKYALKYKNYNKRFLQDLQILLINFGIKTTVMAEPSGIYALYISSKAFKAFLYKIGLTTSSKRRNLEIQRANVGEVEYFTRVTNISKIPGKHKVYDAEEYETHKLIFNGIITGNCSEQYMYDAESCTLGSINLAKFADPVVGFDWTGYEQAVRISTQFLNDVLEVNKYPTEHIKERSNITKRIGLGIMGLADALFKMRIPYNSEEGFRIMEQLAKVLYVKSVEKSIDLAQQRGPCDAFKEVTKDGSHALAAIDRVYDNNFPNEFTMTPHLEDFGVRNMWTTTIAPTGTISMIADCSNGLEPIYALVYKKTVQSGDHYYLNKEFENALIAEGLYSDEIIKKVEANYGSVQGLEEIPEWMQKVFVTAMDLHWTDHVVAQAIWQKWIDNSISKTINMPNNVTPEDIEYAYVLSHEVGLKGVSVYRDGSRHLQVLHTDTSVKQKEGQIGAKSEKETILIKKQLAPSKATIDFINKTVKNQDILERFQKYIGNYSQQIYIQANETCTSCNIGVFVHESGCTKCNSCGFSLKCSTG